MIDRFCVEMGKRILFCMFWRSATLAFALSVIQRLDTSTYLGPRRWATQIHQNVAMTAFCTSFFA